MLSLKILCKAFVLCFAPKITSITVYNVNNGNRAILLDNA